MSRLKPLDGDGLAKVGLAQESIAKFILNEPELHKDLTGNHLANIVIKHKDNEMLNGVLREETLSLKLSENILMNIADAYGKLDRDLINLFDNGASREDLRQAIVGKLESSVSLVQRH